MTKGQTIAGLWLIPLLLGGCVFMSANLDVGYKDMAASPGPLAAIAPRRVAIAEVVDKRRETDKIGYKRHGLGGRSATIFPDRPVPEIVREALATELRRNGHAVVSDEPDRVVSVEVTEFWIDTQIGWLGPTFIASTGVVLTVANQRTATTLLRRTYHGSYREKFLTVMPDGTIARIVSRALEEMMRDLGTDGRLVEALKGPSATAR